MASIFKKKTIKITFFMLLTMLDLRINIFYWLLRTVRPDFKARTSLTLFLHNKILTPEEILTWCLRNKESHNLAVRISLVRRYMWISLVFQDATRLIFYPPMRIKD